MLERRAEDRGTEDDERDGVEQLAALVRQIRHLAATVAADDPEPKPAGEGGNEDAASKPGRDPGR